jgi:hypothetical protein
MSETGRNPDTYGAKAVGLTFNPSNDPSVDRVKVAFADIIDYIDNLRSRTNNAEIKRMASIAITEAQTAQMWSVKALTWKHD